MMTRFMCRFCGRVFTKEEVSTPMTSPGAAPGDWVWMRVSCPACRRGRDDWYVPEREWKYRWSDAVRYQRNAGTKGVVG